MSSLYSGQIRSKSKRDTRDNCIIHEQCDHRENTISFSFRNLIALFLKSACVGKIGSLKCIRLGLPDCHQRSEDLCLQSIPQSLLWKKWATSKFCKYENHVHLMSPSLTDLPATDWCSLSQKARHLPLAVLSCSVTDHQPPPQRA